MTSIAALTLIGWKNIGFRFSMELGLTSLSANGINLKRDNLSRLAQVSKYYIFTAKFRYVIPLLTKPAFL